MSDPSGDLGFPTVGSQPTRLEMDEGDQKKGTVRSFSSA